jgi:hypothetical protein
MGRADKYHGGLVFAGNQDSALDRFCRIVASTFEDYGHGVERQTILDDHVARIATEGYMLKLTLHPWGTQNDPLMRSARQDAAAGLKGSAAGSQFDEHRLEITLSPAAPGREDRELTELMLVVMLYRMVDAFPVRQIEWLKPETVLRVDQFMSAFTNVSPHRVRSRQEIQMPEGNRFASISDTEPSLARHCDAILGKSAYSGCEGLIELTDEEMLALAFRDEPRPDEYAFGDDVPSDVRRLATWGMTGMLAFLSTPVALSVAAVNLVRGEDFRLNTQVLALTGCVIAMHSSGFLSTAVNALPL